MEKVDGQSQVELEVNSTLSQTDMVKQITSETQVPSTLTSVTPTQTALLVTSECTAQTDDIITSCHSTQDHLCCQYGISVSKTTGAQSRGDNAQGNLFCNQYSKGFNNPKMATKEGISDNCNDTPDTGQTPNQVISKDSLCCTQTWQLAIKASNTGDSTGNLVPLLVSANNSQCALEDTKTLNLESVCTERSLCVGPSMPVPPRIVTSKNGGKVAPNLESPGTRAINTVLTTVHGDQHHNSTDQHTCAAPETSLQVKVIEHCTVLPKDDTSAGVKIMPALQTSRELMTVVALENKNLETSTTTFSTEQVQTARRCAVINPATLASKTVGGLLTPLMTSHGTDTGGCGQNVTDSRQNSNRAQFSSRGAEQSSPLRSPKNFTTLQICCLEAKRNTLQRTPQAVPVMGSLPSSAASIRSCQLGSVLSNQSDLPLIAKSVDKSVACADNPEKATLTPSSSPGNSSQTDKRGTRVLNVFRINVFLFFLGVIFVAAVM